MRRLIPIRVPVCPVLARLLSDGSLDPASARTASSGRFSATACTGSTSCRTDGSWQPESWSGAFGMQPWLGRFQGDGAPDASFGQAGQVLAPVPGSWQDVTAAPRGSVLVGGSEGADLVVARYTETVASSARTAAVTAWHSLRPMANEAPARPRTQWQWPRVTTSMRTAPPLSSPTATAPSCRRFKDRTRPAVGNHDYGTPGAAGYFGYFGAAAET
jgi:hypothetical protein